MIRFNVFRTQNEMKNQIIKTALCIGISDTY